MRIEGLSKALNKTFDILLLVSEILEAILHDFETNYVSGVADSVAFVIYKCRDKCTKLKDLVNKLISEEKISLKERYHMAIKVLGRNRKVKSLMKGILQDIQFLGSMKAMTKTNVEKIITMAYAQQGKVAIAILDLAAFWPSVLPDATLAELDANGNYETRQRIIQKHVEPARFWGLYQTWKNLFG